MHAAISGTIDYREPDDDACLARLRRLIALLPPDPSPASSTRDRSSRRARPADDLYRDRPHRSLGPVRRPRPAGLRCSTAAGSTSTGPSTARRSSAGSAGSAGWPLGVVANQRLRFRAEGGGPFQFGGVIYADSADKAARFVLDCNQSRVPLLFIQDVNGFDVGRDAERTGIIRRGAKLVNAVSNSVVPKITLIVGHSFGAGHYALCGKAFDPRFLFAWPGARYAVMGGRAGRADDARRERRRPEAAGQGDRRTPSWTAHGRRAARALRSRDRHPLRRRRAAGSTRSSTRPDAEVLTLALDVAVGSERPRR